MCQKIGLDSIPSNIYLELALLAYKEGDFERDRRLSEKGYYLAHNFGYIQVESQALTALGRASLNLNQVVEAENYLKQALKLAFDTGFYHYALHSLTWIGIFLYHKGKLEKAGVVLSFVSHSAITEKRDQLEAQQHLDALKSKLSATKYSKVKAKGEALSLEDAVPEILYS